MSATTESMIVDVMARKHWEQDLLKKLSHASAVLNILQARENLGALSPDAISGALGAAEETIEQAAKLAEAIIAEGKEVAG